MACGLALLFIRPSWMALGDGWAPGRPGPGPWRHSVHWQLAPLCPFLSHTLLQSDPLAAHTGSLQCLPAVRLGQCFPCEGNHGVQLYSDFSERAGLHAPESPESVCEH